MISVPQNHPFPENLFKNKGPQESRNTIEILSFPKPRFSTIYFGALLGAQKNSKIKNRKGAKKGENGDFRVKLIKFAKFDDFPPFLLKMAFPWPPERKGNPFHLLYFHICLF